VKLVDSQALVEVELAARLVHVASANCEDDEIETAIREAGCTPVRQ
jgi:copper chaperone CopZ